MLHHPHDFYCFGPVRASVHVHS